MGNMSTKTRSTRQASSWSVILVLLFLSGMVGWAQTTANEKTLTVNFFVEPLLQKSFGGTSYDLSYDEGSGYTSLSRLEFPLDSLEAGAVAGISIERGGKRKWLIEAGATHSILSISGTMNDYDWTQYESYPKIPSSYTYSQDSTESWNASLDAAWTFASAGPWSFSLYGLYRYQYTNHVEDSATGWQYDWDSTTSAYDLYVISDSTSDVLEYSLTADTFGAGLLVDLQGFPGFTLELRATYTPVYVSDRDDHKLRTKLSTASGWGNGVYGDFRATYQLPQIAVGLKPYLALDCQITYYVVSTTQTQYWYGNADASNGSPEGTLITGVGHVITCAQYEAGLWLGLRF
jgi:hypothetical protein